MQAACEAGEVFALLEGGSAARAAGALYAAAREPWLARGLLAYHARTGSARALELLARAPEPHARHLLDALAEQLRAEPPARRHALQAAAALAARRPAWLPRLPQHALLPLLMRAARLETEPLGALHALLALAALLPAAPAAAQPHWPELAEALLRADPAAPPAAAAHLQLARLALFHALYATHPCTLLDALRAALADGGAAREARERALRPLLRSVRLHPALLTGSRAREADATRWARVEPHDVLADARRLALGTPLGRDAGAPGTPPPGAPGAPAAPGTPQPGSAAHAARAAAALRPGAEPWFPLAERCGADSAPHTPLPADADAAEPPEAAVEATPENTPAKETRVQFRFPSDSGAVRALGAARRESPPPAPDAYAARIGRVLAERRAAESPVLFAGAPAAWGAGVARPEPRAPAAPAAPAPDAEDREVLELTRAAPDAWPEPEPERAPRPRPARPARAPRPAGPPARRAASCPPARAPRACAAVQTVDSWPEPYEFALAAPSRPLPDDPLPQEEPEAEGAASPCARLDAYLEQLYAGGGAARAGELQEQLALLHAQLLYERWRREAHAERNRRLLGRCRQARALELHNAALRGRVRELARERDELGARLACARAPVAAPAPAEREARLEALLREEREARLRAELRARAAEEQRDADAAALQRARGDALQAARHVEALARAAQAAERRAEHVRRLRRELLVLGEREARLSAAAGAASPGAPVADGVGGASEQAARAACARAEAEAGAALARAEALALRAHELEAALGARDAALGELKRAARHAAEEHAARLRALRDKYEALMRALRAADARRLERDADAS